jgi:polyhydroxybutyrate depolymerase
MACAGLRAPKQPVSVMKQLSHGNRQRHYLVHAPPQPGERRVPLVLVLHGGGGDGSNAERMTGFSQKADAEGFVVAYPYGTGRFDEKLLTWNAGNCCDYALQRQIDDVGFIRVLVKKLIEDYPIDSSRVFVTGMSNGAMMAYRLACEAADVFAGAGAVAGAMNVRDCNPSRPVAMMIIHGRADEHVLFAGGAPKQKFSRLQRVDASVADAAGFWQKHNGCTAEKRSKTGAVERTDYRCTGAPLSVVAIDHEGHTWPGGEKGWFLADAPTREFSATDALWSFWLLEMR